MAGRSADKPPKPREEQQKPRDPSEELLDEAIEETFPASDPPAVTLPHERD